MLVASGPASDDPSIPPEAASEGPPSAAPDDELPEEPVDEPCPTVDDDAVDPELLGELPLPFEPPAVDDCDVPDCDGWLPEPDWLCPAVVD